VAGSLPEVIPALVIDLTPEVRAELVTDPLVIGIPDVRGELVTGAVVNFAVLSLALVIDGIPAEVKDKSDDDELSDDDDVALSEPSSDVNAEEVTGRADDVRGRGDPVERLA